MTDPSPSENSEAKPPSPPTTPPPRPMPPISADDRRAREAVQVLADLGALTLCPACHRPSNRVLHPVIYGDDLLNKGPILPLVCADCGHIATYGVDQTLAAAKTRKTTHG
jgi:hypothetical protein